MSNFKNAHEDWITGHIKVLKPEKSFGFIRGTDGIEYFCHRNDCAEFDDLREGDPVRFVPKDGTKGPRASQVERMP